ncbi:MAG: tRNA epoxyqueuosine(34) reductase QueG [Candidatus Omnitrophica bacterium]|nr:tRNA epoxyqueuosine(34) reductase QueG [Candidatus Omnitrophota bacterium]
MNTQTIKTLAKEVGFDLVGISPPELLEAAKERFCRWTDGGLFGTMDYMQRSRARRLNPDSFFEGARSVIVVGLNYFNGPFAAGGRPGSGRVSRYAWGADYHTVLTGRLAELARLIKEGVPDGFRYKISVDTAPVLERVFAYQAGLGFIGKNTLLISQECGSWIFIGCLFTNLALDYDRPVAMGCGGCRKCIDACPVGALSEPGILDANTCICALTIEHRGAIDETRAGRMAFRIFGCDVCQEVCPMNAGAPLTKNRFFLADCGTGPFLDPDEVFSLRDSEAFSARFKDSPIARTTFFGLLRNACIVAANTGRREYVPALQNIGRSSQLPDWLRITAQHSLARLAAQPSGRSV